MKSQPQNPEFRNNPEHFHPCCVVAPIVFGFFVLGPFFVNIVLSGFSCFAIIFLRKRDLALRLLNFYHTQLS